MLPNIFLLLLIYDHRSKAFPFDFLADVSLVCSGAWSSMYSLQLSSCWILLSAELHCSLEVLSENSRSGFLIVGKTHVWIKKRGLPFLPVNQQPFSTHCLPELADSCTLATPSKSSNGSLRPPHHISSGCCSAVSRTPLWAHFPVHLRAVEFSTYQRMVILQEVGYRCSS